MRFMLPGLCAALTAQILFAAPKGDIHSLHDKLKQMREYRYQKSNCRKVIVLPFANRSTVPGAEAGLDDYTRELFSAAGWRVIPKEQIAPYMEGHPDNSWTAPELAKLSQALGADNVVVGSIEKYRCKRRFGLPLPYLWQANRAEVTLDAAVYQASAGKIVWSDEVSRNTKDMLLGGWKSRDSTRRKVRSSAIDSLVNRYLKTHKA
jgi:TolB-like protein